MALEPGDEQLAQAVRYADFDLGDWRGQRPLPAVLRQHAPGDQLIEHVHHEQRVAVGALVNDDGQRRCRLEPRAPLLQVGGQCRRVEMGEPEVAALPARQQFLMHRLQGVGMHRHLCGPIGTDDQQRRGAAALCQARQQIHRRQIAPMEILEHQHQRQRQRVDDGGHFATHALGSRRGRWLPRIGRDGHPGQ